MKLQNLPRPAVLLCLAPLFVACHAEPVGDEHATRPEVALSDSNPTQEPLKAKSGTSGHHQAQTHQHEIGASPELQVLSYNVYHLPDIAAILHYKEEFRAKAQAKALAAMTRQLDVIVFQEGFNKAAKQHLFGPLESYFPHSTELVGLYCEKRSFWDSVQGNCSNSLFVTNGGVKIISKHPILEKHQYVFQSSAKGTADYNSNKGAVYVTIQKDGSKYHVVGAHLQADQGSFDGTNTRKEQLTELSRWISTFSIPQDEPLIFAGDMNVEYTNQSTFLDMKHILNSDTPYTFDPAFATYSNVSNSIVKTRYPDYNDTLDYILVSNAHQQPTRPSTVEVKRFQKESIDLSDHHAVLGSFTF